MRRSAKYGRLLPARRPGPASAVHHAGCLEMPAGVSGRGCQVIGFDYRYQYVNEAVAEHGRTTTEALLGHRMMEVYPGIDSSPMFSVLQRCMQSREPAEMENEFTYPDGSTGWFMLKMEPVPGGSSSSRSISPQESGRSGNSLHN